MPRQENQLDAYLRKESTFLTTVSETNCRQFESSTNFRALFVVVASCCGGGGGGLSNCQG